MPDRQQPLLLRAGSITILPVCHYRVEFAQLVVAAFERTEPQALAVEIPAALQPAFISAIDRLPFLSVVAYRPDVATVDRPIGYLLVEPADPLVEAARQARRRGLPVSCVDANLFDYPDHQDRLPDPYAVLHTGHHAYYKAVRARFDRERPGDEDLLREAVMAYRLERLAEHHGSVLFVCGMAHAGRVAGRLNDGQASPFGMPIKRAEIDREQVQLFDLHEDSAREVLSEWGYLSAAYEQARNPGASAAATATAAPRIISFVSRRRLLAEIQHAIETPSKPEWYLPLDRRTVMYELFREARDRYHDDTGDEVSPHQLRLLMKFLRNYALVRGRLQPDVYQIVVGARGAVDDNFAYEVWDLATHYPWQDPSGALPKLRLRPEDIYGSSRLVRFHRREKTRRKRPLLGAVRKREKRPGEWAEAFDGSAICSYPPEDVIVENFGGFLRKKAKSVLSEENARVAPFTTSILDGIDVRETIRNWHDGRIFVRENGKVRGEVGSVVVVFDEDREADRYPWLMTWLGEHSQESDMALYATDPGEVIVGPGISRAEYGGFMMTYPPRRLHDVWSDPYYRAAQAKPEVLLMSAIDYSLERLVVYVAANPPRSAIKTFAARFGKKIVYVPIGQLSPVTLKKMRVFHVLGGYDKRTIAKDYIW